MILPSVTASAEILANGLSLILDPDPSVPVVSAQIWVATGSMHEEDRLGAGLSHFLEHMVCKGTRDHDGAGLARIVQGAGGRWNAYTTFDRTVYHIDGPAGSLPVFLEALFGLVFFPTLPEADFAGERDVIRREIDLYLDDPGSALTQMVLGAAFTRDPRRHPVIGRRHLFDALGHANLTGYHARRYVPERCCLVVSGDFSPQETRDAVLRLGAGLTTAGGAEVTAPCDVAQMGLRKVRETFPQPVSRLVWAWKTPPLGHPDTPALQLLAAMLGHGSSSLLTRELREERGLALDISAWLWTAPDREGLFGISADVEPAKRDELIGAVAAELEKLATEPLEESMARARRQYMVARVGNLLTASGRAAELAGNWHVARDLEHSRKRLAALDRVGAGDLRRVAAGLLDDVLTFGVMDPPDAAPPARAAKTARRQGGVREHRLANGVRVALIEDRRAPMISLRAAVLAGLPAENAATSGLNQLLAEVLPKGTRNRGTLEIAVAIENLGARLGALAGFNTLQVTAGGLAEDFGEIAGIFGETIRIPALPAEVAELERASLIAELEEILLDPLSLALRRVRAAYFGDAGYGLDLGGSLESLPLLTRDMLAERHARHFCATNLTLALAGDFDESEALDVLEKALTGLPAGEAWTPPASGRGSGGRVEARLPKKQAALAVCFPGATATGPERYAAALLQDYASDMAGPLFTRLREELGLAYQVGGFGLAGHDAGTFVFYIATAPEQVDLARNELLAEVAKLRDGGVPEDAFGRVRNSVLGGLALKAQSLAATAQEAAVGMLFGLPADDFRRMPEIIGALTPDEVRGVAGRLFSAEPVIATVLPE